MGGFIFRVKPPPTTNSRYLLRGTKFKFLVKTKKFLGGVASMGAKPPGAVRPQGGRRPPSMGWAEGPLTVPRQLGFWPEGPKPKLPPLGRRLEVLAGVRGVTRHVDVVPSESSHVEYP